MTIFHELARIGGGWTRRRMERCAERLLPELYRAARAFVHEPADAEDMVHDTIVKALRGFGDARIDSEAACRAWLHRILVNTFRDRYRREARSPMRVAVSGDAPDDDKVVEFAASREPDPALRLEYDDFGDAAEAAIATLPPEIRIVTALCVINGHTYREIAAITECPMGTVMSRLARGRQALRRELARFVSPEGYAAGRACARLRSGSRKGSPS